MKTTVKIIPFIFTVLVFYTHGFTHGDEVDDDSKGKILIEWDSMKGSTGYRIQVKNIRGKIVLDRSVKTPNIEFHLPPENYKLRIGALNKFGKVVGWTVWSSLNIKLSSYPFFRSISIREGLSDKVVKDIIVKGKNFTQGTRIFLLKGEKKIFAENVRIESRRLVRFDLNLKDADKGLYDLEIKNPNGFKLTKEKIFLVKKNFKPLFEGALKIGAGLSYHYLLPRWDEYFFNTFKSYNGIISFSAGGIGFLNKIKIVKNTGLELETSYAFFEGNEETQRVKTDMNITILGINGFYHTGLNYPVNGIIRAGGGIVSSNFKEYTPEQETYSTRDLYYKIGVSLEYCFLKLLFLEAGTDFLITNYLVEANNSIRFIFLAGVRL